MGVLFCSFSAYPSEELILTERSLGSLILENEPFVSIDSLRKLFPDYQVNHGIHSGDSPDFHLFQIATREGELLFTISSFIEDGDQTPNKDGTVAVPIHLLKVVSPRISDAYGLRVGNSVADILRTRGKNLEFGAEHHDVSLGANRIFYTIGNPTHRSPDGLKFTDAVRGNWRIRSISWPEAAWE
jgi:hypothetical protein